MQAILEAVDVVKRYGATTAVDGVSFGIEAGTCTGLLGPNGAGKTSIIEILEGVSEATAGKILYSGETLGRRFRQEAGIQFQATALQDFLTVRETLELFHSLYDETTALDDLIETCSLQELLGRDNRKLSGGQRQRLLLAIALVNDPKIIFLDEPTTGLDPQARRNFWDLVERIKARGTTILLTTHYMDEAEQLCDRIIIMDNGKVIDDGTPDGLLSKHFEEVVLRIPTEDLPSKMPQKLVATDTIVERGDLTEIHTADSSAWLRALDSSATSLQRLSIRPYNLEDLFIDLTGRELRS